MLKKFALLLFFSISTGIVIASVLLVSNSIDYLQPKSSLLLGYSEFLEKVNESGVKQVILENDNLVRGVLCTGAEFTTYRPNDPHLIDDLLKNKVKIKAQPASTITTQWLVAVALSMWVPMILQIAILIFYFNRWRLGK
jgi:cell division protease FtsH